MAKRDISYRMATLREWPPRCVALPTPDLSSIPLAPPRAASAKLSPGSVPHRKPKRTCIVSCTLIPRPPRERPLHDELLRGGLMDIIFHSHHTTISPRLRIRTEEGIEKLAKRLGRINSATARFAEDGPSRRVEIAVSAWRGKRF